jgi:cytochrome c oxidase assembly protein subunit 15
LTIAIALFTSPSWRDGEARVNDANLRRFATMTTVLVYVQILVGAAMRHTDAGLAIPDFPLMFGRLVPDHWNPKIAVHFAHRVGALIVTLSVVRTAAAVWAHQRRQRRLSNPAALLVALVAVQVTLGALTILTQRNESINSLHVVCGALVLATSLVLTLRSWRVRFAHDRLTAGSMVGSRSSSAGNGVRTNPGAPSATGARA